MNENGLYSPSREALYCLPCRLFSHVGKKPTQSALISGWDKNTKWKKLWERLPIHERSPVHKDCYMSWRELQTRLNFNAGVDKMVEEGILSEIEQWKRLLRRILDVTMFLRERGLVIRGSSLRIGDVDNGNLLGSLELLAHYDPVLREHVAKVKFSQDRGERMQAHYLSPQSQNEFIKVCAPRVKDLILEEGASAKYFSVIVDGTRDSSHIEQTTFILRYLKRHDDTFLIEERFLVFFDCCNKTGVAIALMILNVLKKMAYLFSECRGQGYDNAANMSGKDNGVQTLISSVNPLSLYSSCACISLNLCGADTAESCMEAATFFGFVQIEVLLCYCYFE